MTNIQFFFITFALIFMRKQVFILFLLIQSSIYSQTRTSLECVNREFNVIVHIITDSFYVPTIPPSQAFTTMNHVNNAWKPICMKFNICKVRIDSNFNFLSWHQDTMEAEYLALHHEPRTINIIVVEKLIKPSGVSGYAKGTISTRGQPYIVVAGGDSALWDHELGHYFGLEHTFVGTGNNSGVLADNSNCATSGDKICDTPPDPNGSLSGCNYAGTAKDINGKLYNPLVENYMSYYGSCRKSFTHNQYEKMVDTYKIDKEAHF
jgi:hypothetical protein